eukprot:CAMPEP_0170479680 /NCGR_PEP_ID=MMETSP0208-20121228/818_1 /TAXON_ID=197538 /ORGANISM="Strombidium inclinatum, Strain S3" /LENGTH=75 /DNA_ID=CAMNT_0010752119 /DNA_START=1937 /DNA_END=2165 /DNA_ORIENTATION=+
MAVAPDVVDLPEVVTLSFPASDFHSQILKSGARVLGALPLEILVLLLDQVQAALLLQPVEPDELKDLLDPSDLSD